MEKGRQSLFWGKIWISLNVVVDIHEIGEQFIVIGGSVGSTQYSSKFPIIGKGMFGTKRPYVLGIKLIAKGSPNSRSKREAIGYLPFWSSKEIVII